MFSSVMTIMDGFVCYGIGFDGDDRIVLADCNDHTIKRITSTNTGYTIQTIAGNSSHGWQDGPALAAEFGFPKGLAISRGSIIIADDDRIRKLSPNGMVSTIAGGDKGYLDGKHSQFHHPFGVCLDEEGDVIIADEYNHKIRKVSLGTGLVSTIAGLDRGFCDGPREKAKFNGPCGVFVDIEGNVIVADRGNSKIRKVTPDGDVIRIAGTAEGYEDGHINVAKFSYPMAVCGDDDGNVFVADTYNHCIRMISPDGIVSTVAGNPDRGYVDGDIKEARFKSPSAICLDRDGHIYVCDEGNKKIRKIERNLKNIQ